jgi:hypothetical protein
MNLFGKLKLELHLFQCTSLFPPHAETRARVKPPLVHIPPKHTRLSTASMSKWGRNGLYGAHFTRHFLSINFSNHVAQHQISWPPVVCKHQRVSRAWSKSHSNLNSLNQNVSKQKRITNK